MTADEAVRGMRCKKVCALEEAMTARSGSNVTTMATTTTTTTRESPAFYSKPGCFKASRASFLLWSSITKQQHNEKERELQRRVVPIMGQHGWQLNDDGVSWSRRTSLARAS